MNRYGNVQRVFDAYLSEKVPEDCRGDGKWQKYVVEKLVSQYDVKVKSSGSNINAEFDCSKYLATEADANSSDVSTVRVYNEKLTCILNMLRKSAGNKFFHSEGDMLLKEMVYWITCTACPKTDLYWDVEHIILGRAIATKPQERIRSFAGNDGYERPVISEVGYAVMYVYDKGRYLKGVNTVDSRKYHLVLSDFLSARDLRYMRKTVPVKELTEVVRNELFGCLENWLSIETLNTTPIPVLLYYYIFISDAAVTPIAESQTAVVQQRIIKQLGEEHYIEGMCNVLQNTESLVVDDRHKIEHPYHTGLLAADPYAGNLSESSKLPVTLTKKDIISNINTLLCDVHSVNVDIPNIASKLEQYIKENSNPVTTYFTVKDWLQDCYYRVHLTTNHADLIREAVDGIRKVLPVSMQNLTDNATLLIGVYKLELETDRAVVGIYKNIDFMRYTSTTDDPLYNEYNFSKVTRQVAISLEVFAKDYWFPFDIDEDPLYLLSRCYTVVKAYKKYGRIPLLKIVKDADLIYEVVEEAVDKVVVKAEKKYKLSILGKLLATAAQWKPEQQQSKLDLVYDFTEDDIAYFSSKMKRDVDKVVISSMLNAVIESVSNTVGDTVWRGYLTVSDIMRLYIYRKSCTSTNVIKSKFRYADEYKPFNDTFVHIQDKVVQVAKI